MPSRPAAHARVLAVLLAVLGLALIATPAIASAATLSGTVTGKVGEETKPLSEVKVTVYEVESGKPLTGAPTGPEGGYSIELLPGVYDVRFQPPTEAFKAKIVHKVEVFGSQVLDVTLDAAGGEEPEPEDTEAPLLTKLTLEREVVDTTSGPTEMAVTIGVTDNLTGLQEAQVTFYSPSGEQKVLAVPFYLGEGSPTNGSFYAFPVWPQFSEEGSWRIKTVSLRDNAGNVRSYGEGQLIELGLPTKVFVINEGDHQAPEMTSVLLDPEAVDTTSAAQKVNVDVGFTEDLSGLLEGSVAFTSPSGKQHVGARLEGLSGNELGGTMRAHVIFPRFSEPGGWNLTEVTLVDKMKNVRSYDEGDLSELGLGAKVLVSGVGDTEAPQLTSLALAPEEVEISFSDQDVEMTIGVEDDVAGLAEASATFVSPSGEQVVLAEQFSLAGGTPTNGSYVAYPRFLQLSETGSWRIEKLTLKDAGNNVRAYSEADLAELGFPHKVLVTASEVPDTTPPELLGLAYNPEQIDTTVENGTVAVTAHAADESGIEKITVTFESPSGESTTSGTGSKRVKGTSTNGYYSVLVPFKQGSEAGEWKVSNVRLLDKAFNEVNVPRAELEGAGIPITVTVAAVTPVVESVGPTGPESGGKEVSILGTGFGGVTEVRFGSTSVPFEYISPKEILAISPPGYGTVDVTVTTPGGTSKTGPGAQFSYETPISFSSSPNPSVRGQKVTFTAKIEPEAPGAPTPLGTVAFVNGSNTLGVANLKKGVATLSVGSLGAGKHEVIAQYSGDSTFLAVNSEAVEQVVAKASTEVTLTSGLNPAPYGTTATLKANVKAVAPGAGTPAGTVTFRDGETVLATVQLSGANATYSLKTLVPAEHAITASYSGDANNEPGYSNELIQGIVRATTSAELESSLNPAPYGAAGNLTATVDALAPSVATPTGSVVFSEGETVLANVPLTNGVAKYPLKSLGPGSHAISISYAGGANFEPSAGELTQVVVKADTATTLTSSLNPAPYGSSGTLKATVKAVAPGTGTPTGTVTFIEGETVLATVPLSSGTAKYAFKTMSPGEHAITATYNGDANYGTSGDGATQTIVKATTSLTLTSTKNPAPNGSAGSLKAAVKAVAPGTGQPPGTVTFREGETVLAVVPLSSGSASFPLKSLSPGSHNVTASYGGAANYEPSEDAITQVISP